MERDVNQTLIAAWRWIGSILIYPVTILPGLNAAVLLISSVCIGLDSWSVEGAMSNLSLGLPAVAGIAALWFSTLTPTAWIARSRYRFLLVTTGLMMGLLMECLFLKAGIQNQTIRLPRAGFLALWVFGGPLLAGCVNLILLIRARNRIYQRLVPPTVQSIPPHHLGAERILRPVILQPYRSPATTRWWVPSARTVNPGQRG